MGIYGMGKAFNLRYANSGQYRATHVKRPPARPMCGGHAVSFTENTNVTIKNGPSGFWGFLGGFFGGLFGGGMGGGMSMGMGMPMGMPMGGMSPFGMLNTQMSQVTPQKQNGDRLADLQKMFPDWNIASDGNGKYDAVNKDQTVHHSGNFDEMCQKLLKKPPVEKQGDGDKKANNEEVKNEEQKEESEKKVTHDDTAQKKVTHDDTANTHRKQSNNDNYNNTTNVNSATNKNNNNIDKTKPIRLNMTVALSGPRGTATVVTPDGKTYKVNVQGNQNTLLDQLGKEIIKTLKEAGWTSVTLENKNFKWSSDGTEAKGEVDRPKTTKAWTAEEKAKPIKLNISFAVRSGGGIGNSGSATVTTPDGKLHQVTTGISLTATRARQDLVNKMRAALNQAGWTSVTLENKNFTDWS